MGKMNWLKRMIRKFTSRPKDKCCERYILNNVYRGETVLKEFIQQRIKLSEKSNRSYVVTWEDFPSDQYGKVVLVRNNKVIESAKLMKGKHNLIYWQFYE